MKKSNIQIIIALIVLGGIVFLAYKGSSSTASLPSDPTQVLSNDRTKGSATAPLTIIEYADFQCPACRVYSTWVNAIGNEYAGKVRIVYRYFPLPSHKNSRVSAAAAEAAGQQGKFWEMHALLFDNQDAWSEESNPKSTFEGYATKLGLNLAKFKSDSASSEVASRVDRDYRLGERMKVNATPTLFLNGIKADNPRDYESLKKLVETMLKT